MAAVLRQPHPLLPGPLQLAAGSVVRRRPGPLPAPGLGRRLPDPVRRRLDADIRTGHRVVAVRPTVGGFALDLADGRTLGARAVVAATGGFGQPNRPALSGLDTFTGTPLHVSQYRNPDPFKGQRIAVVGAGNSAVQVAAELADTARASLASWAPVRWFPQRPLGRGLHFRLTVTGLDTAPPARFQASGIDGDHRRRPLARRPCRRTAGQASGVHARGRPLGHLGRRHGGGRRRDHPGLRLPSRPRLPPPARSPRRVGPASTPGRRLACSSPPGVRRAGVAAQPVVRVLAWRRPRRSTCRATAGRACASCALWASASTCVNIDVCRM
ncbi:NAD(P)-binding domain-containing protein [Streptomyces aureus]|uniref:NAD(P)-binding domain-containing protein n=1 Tax=Streptomyces aureus TaxID=193461 RepID=UPI0020B129D0|nr:NAD(P)-binding domain-containing protein [Streptomyces aureus]